jgi:N-acetylmuramoyl-L-alanine amidase
MIRFFALALITLTVFGCSAQRQMPQESVYIEQQKAMPRKSAKDRVELKKSLCVVCLDAGHGGRDGGAAIKKPPLKEKDLSLDVVRRTEKILRSRGMTVFMTRSQDVYVPTHRRTELANEADCDVFVSVHFNSCACPKTGGVEIFYFNCPKQASRGIRSKMLGSCILTSLKESIGTQSRGVKQGNFCVVRETTMPSVLVEAAFMSNPKEAKLLSTGRFLQQIAKGIAHGIETYFLKDCSANPQYLARKRPRRESNARPVA